MIRAASRAAVSPTASSAGAASAVMSAAAPAAVEAASSTTAVETTTTATAVTAATTLRECSRRAKHRHRSDCAKQYLEESGPVHGCNLHPATTHEVRAARTPRPFYTT